MLYHYTIHIPLLYNDRSPIEPEKIAELIVEIEDTFGGYTRSRELWSGYWKTDREYRDTIMLIFIDGPDEIKAELQALSSTYAMYLGQEKIYIIRHLIEEI